jgi:hypothetical protein
MIKYCAYLVNQRFGSSLDASPVHLWRGLMASDRCIQGFYRECKSLWNRPNNKNVDGH